MGPPNFAPGPEYPPNYAPVAPEQVRLACAWLAWGWMRPYVCVCVCMFTHTCLCRSRLLFQYENIDRHDDDYDGHDNCSFHTHARICTLSCTHARLCPPCNHTRVHAQDYGYMAPGNQPQYSTVQAPTWAAYGP